jgi:hypothetical protein
MTANPTYRFELGCWYWQAGDLAGGPFLTFDEAQHDYRSKA